MVNSRQNLDLTTFAAPTGGVEWRISDQPVDYLEAVAAMEARAAAIAEGRADELVWLLEHPPLYTSGTSGNAGDLLDPRFPLFATGRGGQLTYHGPGQRVAYVMLDLKRRRPGCPRLCRGARRMDHPDAGRLQCARRAARGPRRGLGEAAGQGRWLRRQDCCDRRAAEALGVVPRRRHQCRAGAGPFRGDRALRGRRSPLWGNLPDRSGSPR